MKSRLKGSLGFPALFLLFVWCFQVAAPAVCLSYSAQKCGMPCCLQMQSEETRFAEAAQSAASCCRAPAEPSAEPARPAAHDDQTCSAKLCWQGKIFVTATESETFIQAESGIKYLLLKQEQASVRYFAELFRPPRA